MNLQPQSLLRLTAAQKQFFEENGYLLLEQVFSKEEIDEARERLIRLLRDPQSAHPRMKFKYEPAEDARRFPAPPDNPHRVWMVSDTPLAGDWWFRHLSDPRIVDVVVDCLGQDINFHGGFARVKPPGYRSHRGWHQDWPYDRHTRPELLSALIYLDDTWEGAASTRVVPGSHRLGELFHDEQGFIPEGLIHGPGKALCARAGDVAFIHVLLVHQAGGNDTAQNRSCIINEYKSAGARDLWGNPFAFADMPLRRGGVAFH